MTQNQSAREEIARTAWEARRKFIAVDVGEEDDMGPWPPTAGEHGWQEDDAEHVREAQLAEADAILALRLSSGGQGWQDIATAPGDADNPVYVLIAEADGGVCEARITEDGWYMLNNDATDCWGGECFPTHWMSLPEPPSVGTDEQSEGVHKDHPQQQGEKP